MAKAKIARKKAERRGAVVDDTSLPGDPWPPFMLAWHPEAVEFVRGRGWLPRIKFIRTVPGVNGCKGKFNSNGTIRAVNPTLQVAEMTARGWRFLPDDVEVLFTDRETGDLVAERGYMDEAAGKAGPFYFSVWDDPGVVGYGSSARAVKGEFDHDGLNAWRAKLVADGVVPEPDPRVVSDQIKVQETRANRRVSDAHDGAPHVQRKVEAEHQKLADMREAAGQDEDEPPPVKKVRRRRKAKVTVDTSEDEEGAPVG